MRYLGIDLAWAARARTGLAALDEEGVLVASGAAVTRRRDRRVRRHPHRRDGGRRDRCADHRAERHGVTRGGAAGVPGVRAVQRGRLPLQPVAPAVRPTARGDAVPAVRLGHRPRDGARAGHLRGDRGLPAPGDGRAVRAEHRPAVQGQARAARAGSAHRVRDVARPHGARVRRPLAPDVVAPVGADPPGRGDVPPDRRPGPRGGRGRRGAVRVPRVAVGTGRPGHARAGRRRAGLHRRPRAGPRAADAHPPSRSTG